jgi:hypothetical protein
MTALSLTAIQLIEPRPQHLYWKSAKLILPDSQTTTFIFPEGACVHFVQLRVEVIYGNNWSDIIDMPSKEQESDVVRDIITQNPLLEFKMDTSEGTVVLRGKATEHPVTSETFSLGRRLGRLL